MANETKAPVAVDQFAEWANEAKAKAKAAGTSVLEHGSVVNPDPRLVYAVLDGDAPKPTLERHIAFHEARGYRLMEDVQVIGYKTPIVYAIPAVVYADLRGARVERTKKAMKQWGGLSMMIDRPVEFS